MLDSPIFKSFRSGELVSTGRGNAISGIIAGILALPLLLRGTRRATASLLWTYEATRKPLPASGDLSVVTDWHGAPLCIIETQRVDVVARNEITEELPLARAKALAR